MVDIFDTLGRAGIKKPNGGGSGYEVNTAPTANGFGSRQGKISPGRPGSTRRHLMRWLVPEQPIIEMYINPQNFSSNYKKHITKVRTKGGYTLQYWGEELTTLQIGGTTGTSGIEGINVLHDIYRNEQMMFDPYALLLQAERDRAEDDNIFDSLTNSLAGEIRNVVESASVGGVPNVSRTKPTLASLAFTVELYWSGEVYRGFFESFNIKERADNLGLFEYDIAFTVTQKRGFRQNFLGWHRSATNGPSNSNPKEGVPHSFETAGSILITPQKNKLDQPPLNNTFVSDEGGLASEGAGQTILDAFDVF